MQERGRSCRRPTPSQPDASESAVSSTAVRPRISATIVGPASLADDAFCPGHWLSSTGRAEEGHFIPGSRVGATGTKPTARQFLAHATLPPARRLDADVPTCATGPSGGVFVISLRLPRIISWLISPARFDPGRSLCSRLGWGLAKGSKEVISPVWSFLATHPSQFASAAHRMDAAHSLLPSRRHYPDLLQRQWLQVGHFSPPVCRVIHSQLMVSAQ
jgi:hypothetical protein